MNPVRREAGARQYRQVRRAAAADAVTGRIMAAGLALFIERPFDQITLAAVAARADVGLQTVIRRMGTKDGLIRAVSAWLFPTISADRSMPARIDPSEFTESMAQNYERWGEVIRRALHQQDAFPAFAEAVEAGRRAHRAMIEAGFAAHLDVLDPDSRSDCLGRLAAVCSLELWLLLRNDQGLSIAAPRAAVADLISACLR